MCWNQGGKDQVICHHQCHTSERKTPAAPRTESAAPQSQSVYKPRFHWVYKSLYKSGWARLSHRDKKHIIISLNASSQHDAFHLLGGGLLNVEKVHGKQIIITFKIKERGRHTLDDLLCSPNKSTPTVSIYGHSHLRAAGCVCHIHFTITVWFRNVLQE